MTTYCTVSITLEVCDTKALRRAAYQHATNVSRLTVREYARLRRESLDPIGTDLVELLDPGISPEGTQILDSGTEVYES